MSSSGLAIRLYFTSLVKILNLREMPISKFTSVVCSSIKAGSLHFTLWTWIWSCCGPIGSRRRKRIGQLFWWSFLAAFSTFVAFSIVITKLRMEGERISKTTQEWTRKYEEIVFSYAHAEPRGGIECIDCCKFAKLGQFTIHEDALHRNALFNIIEK